MSKMNAMLGTAAMMFVGLPLVGCGGSVGEQEGATESLGSVDEPITRGSLGVGSAQAVKLSFPAWGCSGTKIGNRRFLTAGHCVWNASVGQQVTISNADDGTGGSVYTITAVHRYPTQPANLPSGHSTDIGMIDVKETNSNLPITPYHIRTSYVDDGTTGQVWGFGCDLADPSHGGKKQFASITTQANGDTFFNPSNAGYMYASGNPKPAVCSGDSGGPFYFPRSDGSWEIGGVVAAGDNNSNSWFTRTGRVQYWIANPTINNFASGTKGSLLNYLGNNCPIASTRTALVDLYFCYLSSLPVDPAYWSVKFAGAGTRNIVSTLTGDCLYETSPGSEVIRKTCAVDDRMRWRFVSPVTINGFTYNHIQNVSSNWCIGTAEGTSDAGNLLITKPCSSGVVDEQLFAFVP